MSHISQKIGILLLLSRISVCGPGEYMNNMGGCSECIIGTFQSSEYHSNTVCDNCTGITFIILFTTSIENI